MNANNADVLVIATHPDDAELCCGGTIVKLASEGRKVVIVDCTRGELSSRGNPALREQEAVRAGAIMNVAGRVNLHMPDGGITTDDDNVRKIIRVIRKFRPQLLLMPGHFDRHIDHEDVHHLVRKAVFQSGLTKIETVDEGQRQEIHRPKRMLCYMQTYEFPADLYVDITDEYAKKLQAIRAYSSQFYVEGKRVETTTPETFISRPEYMEFIEARARYFGAKIGVRYAEGFASVEPVGLRSLSVLLDT